MPAPTAITPALPAPPGQVSDFGDGSPVLTANVALLSVTLPILATLVLLRLLTQRQISHSLMTEDFFIITGFLFLIGTSVAGIYCARNGVGAHMWNITKQDLQELLKAIYVFSILFTVALVCTKTAILFQIKRILAPFQLNKPVWLACWACIIIDIGFYMVNVFLQIFRCSPVSKAWVLSGDGHCMGFANVYMSCAIFNVVIDFIILITPISAIARLKMSVRSRLGMGALFAAGALACVASIMRAYYTWVTQRSDDLSYHSWSEGLWCIIEMEIGVVVFCLPVVPRLYHHVWRTVQRPSSSTPQVSFSSVEAAEIEKGRGP